MANSTPVATPTRTPTAAGAGGAGLFSAVKRILWTAGRGADGEHHDENSPSNPRKRSTDGDELGDLRPAGVGRTGAFLHAATPASNKKKPRTVDGDENIGPTSLAHTLNEAASADDGHVGEVDSGTGAGAGAGAGGTRVGNLAKMMLSPVLTFFSPGADHTGQHQHHHRDGSGVAPLTSVVVDGSPVRRTPPVSPSKAHLAVVHDDDYKDFLDEEDEDDFDPYHFMKHLQPLTPSQLNRAQILPRKTRHSEKITLVLDLDETLVHASLEPVENCDLKFVVNFEGTDYPVWVMVRPGCQEFLNEVTELFEVIVFTASQKIYADKLLNLLDPGRKRIKYRVFRDSCVVVDTNYIKELSVLGRDLAHTLLVDNSPLAFGHNVSNGIPIRSWFGEPEDRELTKLLPFLRKMHSVEDVRPYVVEKFRMHEKIARA